MKSGYKIVWTSIAEADLENVINYLEDNWTHRELNKFSKKLDKIITLVKNNPKTFPKSNFKIDIRRAVVNKQNSLYYRKKENTVEILRLFDNRKDISSLEL